MSQMDRYGTATPLLTSVAESAGSVVTADAWARLADQADDMFSYPIQAALAADRHKTMIAQAEAARLARECRRLRRRERRNVLRPI